MALLWARTSSRGATMRRLALMRGSATAARGWRMVCEFEKVSIVTVSYNSAATIRDTIESVLGQDYPNIEYLVIDGGSKDETMSIVQEYAGRIAVVISERDRGIYDAMNKGILAASGDVIGFLNS